MLIDVNGRIQGEWNGQHLRVTVPICRKKNRDDNLFCLCWFTIDTWKTAQLNIQIGRSQKREGKN